MVKCVSGQVRRMKKNCGSKWEPNWVRHYSGSQDEQGEVLNDYCYMTSILRTLRSSFEGHVITKL